MATINPLQKKNVAVPAQPVQAVPAATPFSTTSVAVPAPAVPVPDGGRGMGGGGPRQVVQTPQPQPKPGAGTGTSFLGNANQGTYNPVGDEGNILQNYLNQFLGADSALMRDARTRGIEQAAQMGLQNSSIAAGASQRAALEQVVPLAGQAFDMFGQREQRNWQTGERLGQQDWTSGENRLDRQQQTNLQREQQSWQTGERRDTQQWTSTENRLDRDQQLNMAQVQDWLNNQSFMREFNANLALQPMLNTTQLLNTIMQQALENPQVYTPDIISGMSEFFTTNFLDVLSRYFPNLYASQGG